MRLKQIKNYNNYFCDIYGNIYSNKMNNRFHLLKQEISRTGKKYVSLYHEGKCEKKYVDILIYTTFMNINVKTIRINHKDRNKLNNNLNNLEIFVSKETLKSKRKRISNTSYPYIYKHKNSYQVRLGTNKYIKSFKTVEEALTVQNKIREKLLNKKYKELCK